jgi:hypothetical protein
MEDFSTWESRDELLKAAREHGVTARKLARWHYEGLLPRPRQHSIGRGRGTHTFYPPGTTHQLLSLCEIHKNERRLAHVAWKLWWQGYDVNMDYIRSFINDVLNEWQRYINDYAANPSSRIRNKSLRKAMRRVENKAELERALLQIVSGGFDPKQKAADEVVWDVEAAIGLEPGNMQLENRPRLNSDFLYKLSHIIKPVSLSSALSGSSDQDLIEARDGARWLLSIFESLRLLTKESLPKHNWWIINLGALIPEVRPDIQALAVLLFRKVLSGEDGGAIRRNIQSHKESP